MAIGHTVRSATLQVLVGNIAYAASQFAILLLIQRYDSSKALGQYSLALAITAPVALLFDLKLRIVQVTDSRTEFAPAEYVTLRWGTTVFYLTILTAVGLSTGGYTGGFIVAISAFKAVESINDIYYGTLQRSRDFASVALIQSERAAVTIVGTFLAMLSTGSTLFAAWLNVGSMLLITIHTAKRVRRRGMPTLPRRDALSAVASLGIRALPVGLSVTVGSLFVNVPRYFVSDRLGHESLARYAVISYALVATSLVAQGLAEANLPRLADDAASPATSTKRFVYQTLRLCGTGLVIGLFGAAVAAVAAAPTLKFLLGQDYASESGALVILLVASAVQYCALYLGVAINALRIFSIELPINAVALAALAVSCWSLIEGTLSQAAVSVLISQVIVLAGYALVFWKSAIPKLARTRGSRG